MFQRYIFGSEKRKRRGNSSRVRIASDHKIGGYFFSPLAVFVLFIHESQTNMYGNFQQSSAEQLQRKWKKTFLRPARTTPLLLETPTRLPLKAMILRHLNLLPMLLFRRRLLEVPVQISLRFMTKEDENG